ncbi:MAG: DUF177 domain-containing protein [Proteobacteria bacterium]|nr:DUF177 domain-containing protein [Pseudomonadota bacterium]MCL2308134.1 DUF177 domain-containing protein [Pseudomonadota bacterium]
MTNRMPVGEVAPRIDVFRFIEAGDVCSGEAPIARLERLLDRLPETVNPAEAGTLAWQVRGLRDVTGRPALEILVEGTFPLVCQRCLQRLDWPVAQRTVVLVARTPEALVALDDEVEQEVILGSKAQEVLALVEDELLLSLPFAPMHETDCEAGV